MTTTMFSDLPFERRMELRAALENAGASVDGYADRGVYVAIQRGRFCNVEAAARAAGFAPVTNLHHFPLGSDNPPEQWRHDGNYTGSRGFWLRGIYLLAEVA